MILRTIIIILLIMPFLSYSQAGNDWKLYLDKKQIATSNVDSIETVQVQKNSVAALKFVFTEDDTAWVRKIIVMDKKRKGIDSKMVTANANEVVFDTKDLYQQSNAENLSFYIVNTPADPAKAALVRVAPRLICNLQWID